MRDAARLTGPLPLAARRRRRTRRARWPPRASVTRRGARTNAALRRISSAAAGRQLRRHGEDDVGGERQDPVAPERAPTPSSVSRRKSREFRSRVGVARAPELPHHGDRDRKRRDGLPRAGGEDHQDHRGQDGGGPAPEDAAHPRPSARRRAPIRATSGPGSDAKRSARNALDLPGEHLGDPRRVGILNLDRAREGRVLVEERRDEVEKTAEGRRRAALDVERVHLRGARARRRTRARRRARGPSCVAAHGSCSATGIRRIVRPSPAKRRVTRRGRRASPQSRTRKSLPRKARARTEHRVRRGDRDARLAGAREEREERRLEARDVEDEAARRAREDGLEGGRRLIERRGDARRRPRTRRRRASRRRSPDAARGIGDEDAVALLPKVRREAPAHAPGAADEEERSLRTRALRAALRWVSASGFS